MTAYFTLSAIQLKLAFRDRSVLFFNYFFPLIFFFVFAEALGGATSMSTVVTMVLVLGVLGNGLFGAGMRAAQEREQNILRRFKVTPITPAPMLVASMVTGLLTYLPVVGLILFLAVAFYGMPLPTRPVSLLVLLSLGVVAFRAIGLIVASVVNSMQESHLVIQLLYMPMLLLSGATFPLGMLPGWARVLSEFLPASYLVTALQGIFLRQETLLANWLAASALCATTALSLFISIKLFRWDKTEKLRPSAKLWVVAVLAPFIVIGTYRVMTQSPTAAHAAGRMR